jgi:hypothetical protein
MIINPTKNAWEIIYHRAHALLAAQLAGQLPLNCMKPWLLFPIMII